jgi:regulator of protease activity HflC (stomatin/prohibitin superfamily)
MSGSRDSVFYELGKLLGEAERSRDPSSRAVGDDAGGRWGMGDEPRRRWGRLLLYAAVVAVAAGLLLPGLPALDLILVGFLLAGIAAVLDAVEIVQAYEMRALTVFGADEGLLEPGLHLVPPFVSRTYAFDMRTEALDVPRQEAITRDNSPVIADAVVYIRVKDAKKAFLGVDDYRRATSLLAQTSLRAVIGDMELDGTLSKREEINTRIRAELDEPTDAWGVEVEAVEVREVMPSDDVKSAMEQQSSAERRRRAMILEAQGERRSAVLEAEGAKASNVIRAQGEKQARILEAQGDSVATVLRARAAEAMGERAVIEAGLETLAEIGSSPSTTFVLPQELTSLVGRYGKHLSGSDAAAARGRAESSLHPLPFDEETRELLGLDDIASTLAALDEEGEVDIQVEGVREGEDDLGRGRDREPEADPE